MKRRKRWKKEREEGKPVTLRVHILYQPVAPLRAPIGALRSPNTSCASLFLFSCIHHHGLSFSSGVYRVLTQATCIDMGIGGAESP